MHAKIQPISTFNAIATQLFVGNVSVNLGASASLQWWLHQDDGSPLFTGTLELVGDEYAAWGDDDAALFAVVASKIGVTILEVLSGGIKVIDTRTPHVQPDPHINDEPAGSDGADNVIADS